tara:strand:- start:224 stop:355 length:132 start_codon:yes stop_codon:yes gene_type:complete
MSNLKYIVWVGGVPNYFERKKHALIEMDYWLNKKYDDVIIEKI